VNSVTRIDALSHEIEAEIFIELSWILKKPQNEVNVETEWSPHISLLNCVSEVKTTGRLKSLGESAENRNWTQMARSWCVRGAFTCYFQLRHFPFDDHVLYIHAISYQPYGKVIQDQENQDQDDEKKRPEVISIPGRIEWRLNTEESKVLNKNT